MTTPPPNDLDSDEQLLARAAGGDAQAFAALFRRRQAAVYRFALHMTGSAPAADDVTQDVFVVVMRDASRYQAGRSGVVPWLCGIARNCARQRLDRDRPFLPLDPADHDDEDESGNTTTETDPLGELTRAEGIERVRKAVLSLPVRYREAVVLCDLQELSYAEAADALACAVGTVRSRLHRARSLLAEKLSANDPSRWKVGEGRSRRATGEARPAGLDGAAKLNGTRSCA
jgi:RNA polymerase sigma-70 factor, ECF subfamily